MLFRRLLRDCFENGTHPTLRLDCDGALLSYLQAADCFVLRFLIRTAARFAREYRAIGIGIPGEPLSTYDKLAQGFGLRYQPIGLPTGRSAFPSFVARSVMNPGSELKDWRQWVQSWADTRKRLADEGMLKLNRWHANAPVCA